MLEKQALACAVATLAVVAGAQARELSPSLLAATASMTPMERAAFLRDVRGATAAKVKSMSGSKLDVTPPVLTSFHVTPPADTSAPLAQIRIDVQASDNLSGVTYLMLTIAGPHGQEMFVGASPGLPAKQTTQSLALDVSAYTEPGVWTVMYATVSDAAGNYQDYYDPQIGQIGDASFTLVNSHAKLADYTSPVVTQGVVVTPTLSASGTLKGTNEPLIAAIDMTVKDGNAGVANVSGTWCLADMSSCLYMNGGYDYLRGDTKKTLRLWSGIGGAPAGDYLPYQVFVSDHAYNYTTYQGADFGGTSDFSTLMPAGDKITVTP
jgi:hypothetical protein